MIVPPLKVAILSSDGNELHFPAVCPDPVELHHFHDFFSFIACPADLYIDVAFRPEPVRIKALATRLPAVVMVNSVIHTTEMLGESFLRFNGWPGFGNYQVMEIAGRFGEVPKVLEQFAAVCGIQLLRVPDTVGMVRPRVVSMIINEAWLSLGEGVSSRADMDVAMKLGTNYPFGPFEWGEKIGLHRVVELLQELTKSDPKYQPAPALVEAVQTD